MAMEPSLLPGGVAASCDLPRTACLRVGKQAKVTTGRWLDGAGLAAYLAAGVPDATLATTDLYKRETRLGIALDANSRTAETGALYTTETVSFAKNSGFLVGVEGAGNLLPESGLLRLGGDGKGARYRRVNFTRPSIQMPGTEGRFRLILQTPGLFSSPVQQNGQGRKAGWLPNGIGLENGSYLLRRDDFSAHLVCAAIPRHDVISGWDLANWRPKTAERTVPAGSVYWFEDFQGDPGKLAGWVADGLWGKNDDKTRRAEGFNRACMTTWT